MKNLLSFTLFLAVAALSGQSFEWNDQPAASPHPKEVQPADLEYVRTAADRQNGLAGVYASTDVGSLTAYGEPYQPGALTGSHAELPLGTLLRVTNTVNGRSVVVRVTDRGRECEDCLITLSEAAAVELGIRHRSAVSLEESGFSNWNPVPARSGASPVTYENESPETGIIAPSRTATRTSAESTPAPTVMSREVTPASVVVAPPPTPTVARSQQARGVEVSTMPSAERYSVQMAAYANESYAQRRVEELKALGADEVFYRSVRKDDGQVINRVYVGNFSDLGTAQEALNDIRLKFNISGIVAKM